jgi:FAD-dependent urate hydroxylase
MDWRPNYHRSMTSRHSQSCEVAVVGAGPYGLSVAAHLRRAGISTRVFGEPMAFWRRHMPKGMLIRSPWRATHFSSPDDALSLDAYAVDHGIDPEQRLSLDKFVAYGVWFQSHAVPDLDRRAVRLVDPSASGFRLTLADGEVLTADRVVVATGLHNQEYRPEPLRDLPAELVSHTCGHSDLGSFRGKRVAVIGRGQSACESAALLSEAGAETELISRDQIHWLGNPESGAGWSALGWQLKEVLKAPSEVGPFPLSWLAEFPAIVQHLPIKSRSDFTRRCLKPAASGWLKPRFANVTCNAGRTVNAARAVSGRIALDLDNGTRTFDHVLLGTGYRIDIARLGFLSTKLLEKTVCADGSPLLTTGFESSVPKLHFVGSYGVKSFGPLLRFIAGAPFAAHSVANAVRRGHATISAPEFPRADRLFDGPVPNPASRR